MTIRRMRIACWIPKATNTHMQYALLTAFPLQQWLHERASILRYMYTACLLQFRNITVVNHKISFSFFFSVVSTAGVIYRAKGVIMNVNFQRFNSGLHKEKLTQDSGFPGNYAVSHGEWFAAFPRLLVPLSTRRGLNMYPYIYIYIYIYTNRYISYM